MLYMFFVMEAPCHGNTQQLNEWNLDTPHEEAGTSSWLPVDWQSKDSWMGGENQHSCNSYLYTYSLNINM